MTSTVATERTRSPLYGALIGLAALAVLLQGLWAGLFVQEGKDYESSWVEVHDIGARAAIVLAVAAAVVAFVKLRANRVLVIGTPVFAVLLVLEAYLGGKIGESPALTAVHFPLAMALMALAVYLPLRAVRG